MQATEFDPTLGVYFQERPRAHVDKVVLCPEGQNIPFKSWEDVYKWSVQLGALALKRGSDD